MCNWNQSRKTYYLIPDENRCCLYLHFIFQVCFSSSPSGFVAFSDPRCCVLHAGRFLVRLPGGC